MTTTSRIIAVTASLMLAAPEKSVSIFTDEDGQIFIGYEGEILQPLSSY